MRGPITVSGTETVAAIAAARGFSPSVIGSAAYTINTTAAATPTFSPAAGTYTSSQTVTIGDATPGTTIYYTTNGSTPTTNSPIYAGPLTVSGTEAVAAIAAASGYSTSAVGSAAYTINTTAAATPTFSPSAGTYTSSQTVTIGDATPGATIYYTTNGSTPTTSSPVYAGPLTVSATETVHAVAAASRLSRQCCRLGGLHHQHPAGGDAEFLSSGFSWRAFPHCRTERRGDRHDNAAELIFVPTNFQLYRVAFRGIVQLLSGHCDTGRRSGLNSSHNSHVAIDPGFASQPPPWIPGSTLALALCFFGRKRRRGLQMLMLALAALGLSVCSGCGSDVHSEYQISSRPKGHFDRHNNRDEQLHATNHNLHAGPARSLLILLSSHGSGGFLQQPLDLSVEIQDDDACHAIGKRDCAVFARHRPE
jgi:hypothetical protein